MATAERIDYPALLPEDPADELLTEMLAPAPYEVSEKKAKKKATGTRRSSRRNMVLDSSSEDTRVHSSNDNEEEEEENPLPENWGGGRRGRPPFPGRPKGPRGDGPSLRTTPQPPPIARRSGYPGASPW